MRVCFTTSTSDLTGTCSFMRSSQDSRSQFHYNRIGYMRRLPTAYARVSIVYRQHSLRNSILQRQRHYRQHSLASASFTDSIRYATGFVSSNIVYQQHSLTAASFTDSKFGLGSMRVCHTTATGFTPTWFNASSSHDNVRRFFFHTTNTICKI